MKFLRFFNPFFYLGIIFALVGFGIDQGIKAVQDWFDV